MLHNCMTNTSNVSQGLPKSFFIFPTSSTLGLLVWIQIISNYHKKRLIHIKEYWEEVSIEEMKIKAHWVMPHEMKMREKK